MLAVQEVSFLEKIQTTAHWRADYFYLPSTILPWFCCLAVELCICLQSILVETLQRTVILGYYVQVRLSLIESEFGSFMLDGFQVGAEIECCSLSLCSISKPAQILAKQIPGWKLCWHIDVPAPPQNVLPDCVGGRHFRLYMPLW